MMEIEYDAELADEAFEELPESGDTINLNGDEHVIKTVNVVNESKLLLVTFEKRETKRYEEPTDHSVDWDKLPKRFLAND